METTGMDSTNAWRLSQLLKVSEVDDPLWSPDDLAAIMRHQLAIPVQFDLGGTKQSKARQLRLTTTAQGLLLKSFADLLLHPHPPLELLRLTKDFSKANRNHPESGLPHDVATGLYYASIAAALVRCRKRITRLDNDALGAGFRWACRQTWMDDRLYPLFEEALRCVDAKPSGGDS